MANKIAFLFPGQGSQFIGMGSDLMEQFPEVKDIFGQVDEICKKSISKLCFEGPMSDLTITENLQPAITAVNLACLAALNNSGLNAAFSAGHSLGEYSALVSAAVVSEFDALKLVQKRGELMHREATNNPGSMAAVIGMNRETLEDVVIRAGESEILAIANHNTAEQIVITGEQEAVSRAIKLVKEEGKKAIPLKVSGAWHCNLMSGAVNEFRNFMEEIDFSEPKSGILFNATANTESAPEMIKDIMANQLTSPVMWYDIMVTMINEGIETFVEVGPKKVLTGLLKKTVPAEKDIKVYNVQDLKSLKEFCDSNV